MKLDSRFSERPSRGLCQSKSSKRLLGQDGRRLRCEAKACNLDADGGFRRLPVRHQHRTRSLSWNNPIRVLAGLEPLMTIQPEQTTRVDIRVHTAHDTGGNIGLGQELTSDTQALQALAARQWPR